MKVTMRNQITIYFLLFMKNTKNKTFLLPLSLIFASKADKLASSCTVSADIVTSRELIDGIQKL